MLADIDGYDRVPAKEWQGRDRSARRGGQGSQTRGLLRVGVQDQGRAVALLDEGKDEKRAQIREELSPVKQHAAHALEQFLGQTRLVGHETHAPGAPDAQLVVDKRRQIERCHTQGPGIETPGEPHPFAQGPLLPPVEPEFHHRPRPTRRDGKRLVPPGQIGGNSNRGLIQA